MKYIDIVKFYENKDSRINKLSNLTNEQKEEIKYFFRLHNEQESKIDWNRKDLTYDDFKLVMDDFNNRRTRSAKDKIANKQGIEGLVEGRDYKYLGEFTTEVLGTFRAYIPLSWLGAKTIAGKKVSPINEDKDSAAWCIGYSSSISFWNQYFHNKGSSFVIICGDDVPTKKVCFEIIALTMSNILCWDYYDRAKDLKNFFIKTLDSYIDDYNDNNETLNILRELFEESVELSDKRRPIDLKEQEEEKRRQEEEKARKKKELEDYRNSLPTINFILKGNDFPFIQVGTRPEGKVFMSKYLTSFNVPFSPRYEGEIYIYGCNHWDISILRQWLNSDEPAGQWYHEFDVEGYKVDWDRTNNSTKNFINNTPGFLKLIGLSKSDLNPVTNITYTTEGKPITIVDYVWIPSLSELSTKSDYDEGKPLQYWKKILGDNANTNSNENRIMLDCYNKESAWYWLRSAHSDYPNHVRCVYNGGGVGWDSAYRAERVVASACLK